eukprot:Tamp_05674.p1 GENE.Tamp_05674~~Tamp_05674.p1  ORF type:complete len:861 (-),score=200.11 Tamp_05674:324-2735(-)
MAWVRYTKMCHRHLKQLDPHRHPGGAANLDRPEFIRSGFDLAIFALFAGDRVLEDSNLWKDRSHWQRVLQEAGVLETWEDELWLELRDLFTSEIKRSFEEQSSLEELLMSKIASAVDHVETSVAWYEGGEMGMGAKSLAKVLGRVQRDLVAMDIQGLVCSLEEEAAEAERRVKQQQQSEESAVLLLGVMAHVCLSLKVTLFMHGGQALVDRTHGAGGFEILAPGTADPQKESKWEEAMEKVLRGIDNVCKAYVQQLIVMGSWADVPVTLRLIMNHAVRGPHQGGGPLSEAFNKVLARVEADNEAHVHMLAVRYLQAFEIDVADAHERRERMDDLKLWVGADMFKKAGHDMVSKLDGNAEATIDVGERVHELFQPRYGDWYQGVRQGHGFLKKFCAAKEDRKVSDVVSNLLRLIQSTANDDDGAGAVDGYGAAAFSLIVSDLRELHAKSKFEFGRSWDVTLEDLLRLKVKADGRLRDYMAQRADAEAAGGSDPRMMTSQQIVAQLEALLPGSDSPQARLSALKASLPLARAPQAVGMMDAAEYAGEVGCLWGGGTEAEELSPTLWAGVDACTLYLGALRQLHLLLPETPPAYQARVLSLGSLILQLARVCVWSAIADVGHGDISRSSLAAFDEAYARVIKGDTDRSSPHMIDLAASLHLHRIVAFLRLRPIWGAIDRLPQRDVADAADLSSICAPLVDKLIGYQTVPRTEPVHGSYMDVVRRCVSMRSVLLDHPQSPVVWVRRWCAHAVGLASLISHPSLGIMDDMSSECIEELLHTDLAFYSMHLFCDKSSMRGSFADAYMAS